VTGDQKKPMLRVEVVYALREEQVLVALELPEGATVRQAVEKSWLLRRFPDIDPVRARVGIFGRVTADDARLEDGDRVEIYRPLAVDPKDARRDRAGPRRPRKG
jgi:putative ubiquitin-RnfH superfamily antitoxin RatB of RatAB toxin-antitoxin module